MELALLETMNAERAARRACVLVTVLADGRQRLVRADEVAADPLAEPLGEALRTGRSGLVEADGEKLFLTVEVPPPRLLITGAVHISQALAPMAAMAGLDVTILDPRTAFATPERFPGVDLRAEWPEDALPGLRLDPFTAVAALSHEARIDDPALVAALEAGCFYVGALGSRRTHAARLERLAGRGVAAQALASIRAPIGLDIGAANPAEIAVSVLAQVIAALRRMPLGRVKGAGAPGEGKPPVAGRAAAVVLAAGLGSRMKEAHKLTAPVGGVPLVRRAVEAALASKARPVVVVTGHEEGRVREALTGLDVVFAHNPDYAAGLSTSLRAGIVALPAEVDRAVVMLADMPAIEGALVDRLAGAIDGERLIAVPVAQGRRGNPVAWSRRMFPALTALAGDVGARAIIAANAALVAEVACEDEAIFLDIDTRDELEALALHEIAEQAQVDAGPALEAMKAEDA